MRRSNRAGQLNHNKRAEMSRRAHQHTMNSNHPADADRISDEMAKMLQGWIGRPLSAGNLARIAKTLGSLSDEVTCRMLWDTMSTWDKCKWFLCNRLIPSIGTAIRDQNTRAHSINQRAQRLPYSTVPEPLEIPSWANSEPYSVLLAQATVYIAQPLTSIRCTINTPFKNHATEF